MILMLLLLFSPNTVILVRVLEGRLGSEEGGCIVAASSILV